MAHPVKKINTGWLVLAVAMALLLYLLYESRQRTRQLNSTLKNISTGSRN